MNWFTHLENNEMPNKNASHQQAVIKHSGFSAICKLSSRIKVCHGG